MDVLFMLHGVAAVYHPADPGETAEHQCHPKQHPLHEGNRKVSCPLLLALFPPPGLGVNVRKRLVGDIFTQESTERARPNSRNGQQREPPLEPRSGSRRYTAVHNSLIYLIYSTRRTVSRRQ